MRVSDYIASRLGSLGLDTCFMVTGGGAMHLNDAFGAEPRLKKIYCHHEQALSIAAEAYARIARKPALVNVTAGPGGINALNGVFGAFSDSMPMVVVSGQVKRETSLLFNPVEGLRQLGDQEVNILEMVRPITKWRASVGSPAEVAALVDRAYVEAVSGRPGPVWLDVPIDVQGMALPEDTLPAAGTPELPSWLDCSAEVAETVLRELSAASRPVILAGSGIRIAGAEQLFLDVIDRLGIPVTTAWTHDIIHEEHPLFAGRPGTIGTRAGNFVLQNADCVLVLGSRLNIRQVSYNWQSFARDARKIWIDIDPAELRKPFVQADMAINAHLVPFLQTVLRAVQTTHWTSRHEEWRAWCARTKQRYSPHVGDYPVVPDAINPYHFVHALFEHLTGTDIVACGDATATIVPFQIGKLKRGTRLFSNSGCASMGYDLPAAIGAATAAPGRRVICLAGDGSVMMNLQELQTIRGLGLNIKIFILDNGGYLSIKQTQRNFFKREYGTSPASGLTFPEFERVGKAFDLESVTLQPESWRETLRNVLDADGPVLCVVPLDTLQEFQPRLKSRMVDGVIRTPELEDMFPFLDAAEIEFVRQSARAIGAQPSDPDETAAAS